MGKGARLFIPDNEKNFGEPEKVSADKNQYELPHMCEISVSFTPILNVLARRGPTVPLITPADKGNKFLKDYESILE